jgi:hypothetical protein
MSVPDPSLSGMTSFPNLGRMASRGNRLATIVSAFAFAFSGVSFYETVMKQPNLTAYVPPVLHYARDASAGAELFAVPVTIANDGARTGTVLSMELSVQNLKTKDTKRYYSAYFGDHPKNPDSPVRAFAPLSILGRSTFTDTIRFYPIGNPLPYLTQDAGDFAFTLTLATVTPPKSDVLSWFWRSVPAPLVFTRKLPWISQQQLEFRRLAIPMIEPGWSPQAADAEPAPEPASTPPKP